MQPASHHLINKRTGCCAAGIGINYFLDPRLARATWIWPSLLCFSLASVFGTLTHVRRFKALKARR